MANRNTKNRNHASDGPAFSVQDEIRRDRKLRNVGKRRTVERAARAWMTALLCIAICVLLACVVVFSVFRVDTVTVSGNSRYSVDEIISASEIAQGDILPLIRTESTYAKIASSCAYISKIELVKTYPSGLEIQVTEVSAVYTASVRDKRFTLDRDLRVIDYTDETDGLTELRLPKIKSAVEGSRIVFADSASDVLTTSLLDIVIGTDCGFVYDSIVLSDKYNLYVTVNGNAKIILGDSKDVDVKLQVAKKVYDDASAEQSKRTLIDASEPSKVSATRDYSGAF